MIQVRLDPPEGIRLLGVGNSPASTLAIAIKTPMPKQREGIFMRTN
jgi:hypothetical protein